METSKQQQQRVESFWDSKPCDSDRSVRAAGTIDYFIEIEQDRYRHQSHIPQLLSRLDLRGMQILEIGTGVGTDARFIITHGGIYTGVNVDEGSATMTRRAITVFGLTGSVEKCSATALPYPDAFFDIVYSFGVLHHIPDVDRAIAEIYRVLKPGGKVLIMLYNRNSVNYYLEIMFLRKVFLFLLGVPGTIPLLSVLGFPRQKLERHHELYRVRRPMSNEEWLSRNTDGPDNPFSRVYGRNETAALLKQFTIESQEVHFFDARHWGIFGRILPRSLVHWIGRRWGWHRVVFAKKPA